MKATKTETVKMLWDTFTFPIKVGTPISKDGTLANNANAYGLVMDSIPAKPDANKYIYLMTGGIVDMEEIVSGFGSKLTADAMNSLGGISVFENGKRVGVFDKLLTPVTNVVTNNDIATSGKMQLLASQEVSESGLYIIKCYMNYTNTKPEEIRISKANKDGTETGIEVITFSSGLSSASNSSCVTYIDAGITSGIKFYGRWSSNANGCIATMETTKLLA